MPDADSRNLTFDLIDRAQRTPDAPALLLADRDMSYAELDSLTWASAEYLHENGVRAGDIVAFNVRDDLSLALCLLAAVRLGATVFTIPPNATAYQRENMLSQVRASALVQDHASISSPETRSVFFSRDLIGHPSAGAKQQFLAEHPTAPWLIITGSGSTGLPRLIPISHARARARIMIDTDSLGISADDRMADFSRFDFADPKTWLLRALHTGAAFAPASGLTKVMDRTQLTFLSMTVFFVENILRHKSNISHKHFKDLRVLCIGSAMVSDDLRRRIVTSLCRELYVDYGTNEAGPITLLKADEVTAYSGSVGRPLPGVDVEIVDERGVCLPVGATGLIRVRSPGMFNGYLRDDAATHAAFKDGWLYPGDVGKFNDAGHLIYNGRSDSMMIMNGVNIYPAEIEREITHHPAVMDAAAMPLKHPVHQDIPVCAVALHRDAQATDEDLMVFAAERLGGRRPHRVIILDQIPRNEQGKLIRAELARQVASKLGLRRPLGSATR